MNREYEQQPKNVEIDSKLPKRDVLDGFSSGFYPAGRSERILA